MSLLNLLSLDDKDIDTVTTVVRTWCEKHRVAFDSECGQPALAAVNRVIAGEKNSRGAERGYYHPDARGAVQEPVRLRAKALRQGTPTIIAAAKKG
ncbi:hypothetical protein WGT02_24155 (plasmid) [Rhizobium sp. T1470]|uniref:hypothetical protein n=1 Tax=unclassified Rhizobium TaxID=2613769 RepID=UPI001AAFD45C|nr:hypothetical protein [Rhizobium sp. T1473]MCA0804389.1 hypothetical protein [Rhizobium sp. T1473]